MKNLFAFFLLLASMQIAVAQADHLTITPKSPKAGETVHFEYDVNKSPLSKAEEAIEIEAIEYANDEASTLDLMVQHSGGKVSGQFTMSKDAQVAMLAFKSGERWDNNKGEGYFISLHNASGKVMPETYAAQAVLYRSWGGLFELNRKAQVGFDLLNKAFTANPDLKPQFYTTYLSCLMSVKRGDAGKTEARNFLMEVTDSGKLSETSLVTAARYFDRLAAPKKAAQLREEIQRDFPKGSYVRQKERQKMRGIGDLAKLESAINSYKKDFPATTDAEQEEHRSLYSLLGSKAAEQKKWKLVKMAAAKMAPAQKANLYNSIAWKLAENGEDLDQARMMSAAATEWSRNEMLHPTQAKPAHYSNKNWERTRKYSFAQNADTYAFVLFQQNDAEGAAAYQAQAVDITEGDDAEMNERYAEYLEKIKAPDLRYQLEGFIIRGQATTKMKELFTRLYTSEDKSTAGTEAYLAQLEKVAKANKRKEIAAKMLDQAAPAFQLKNLDGQDVSLASLKGKVVVVDFWATWCGPCKASFPGMQKTQDNFKEDPNVAFVFVDTWERVEDKAKNAADFINNKGYSFNVLLDNDNEVVSSFGVSGIPTKFIVDKRGKIRFKSVGYAGSDDALIDELTAMIELAKEQP